MSNFQVFGKAVHNAYNTIVAGRPFLVEVDKDELWAHYLASFPEGTNKMFRERTEYDCSTCRNFVKNLGAVIAITEKGEIHTVWDIKVDDQKYQAVTDAMSAFIKSKKITGPFVVSEPYYGAPTTHSNDETWHHFHGAVLQKHQWRNVASDLIGEAKNDYNGLKRSFKEISDDAIETVLELIAQDSLYLGQQKRPVVELLRKLKREYAKLKKNRQREIFLWLNATERTRFHSDLIGTMLLDITKGKSLEEAVGAYEAKAAGPNYRRPKALVTQKMIDAARKEVERLGIEDSLYRRYAVKEDISVNDVLFVDGSVKPQLLGGAFDNIKPTKKATAKTNTVDEINIKDFLTKVLPTANELEVFFETSHISKLVSLIAPVHAEAKPLLKWDNGFSWMYNGEVSDAIRTRVKEAGGKVDGDVRVSLSWHNADDLDMSMVHGTERIWFRVKKGFGATLDIDMNGLDKQDHVHPVENIYWEKISDMKPGRYEIIIHNYSKRSTANVGFEVQIEILGDMYNFEHPQDLRDDAKIKVGALVMDKHGNVTVEDMQGKFVKGSGRVQTEWGITTGEWVPVELITRSPNFWNDQKIGNEHVFFMLKGCVNEESTRGFLNEYLRDDLHKHRKAFELISASLKAPASDKQLSGVGFSVSNRAEMKVRVKGSHQRVLNVKF